MVLKEAAPSMGENSKKNILEYLRNKLDSLKETYSDERTALYEQFDVLQWLLKHMNGGMGLRLRSGRMSLLGNIIFCRESMQISIFILKEFAV